MLYLHSQADKPAYIPFGTQALWVCSSGKSIPIYFLCLSKIWGILHYGSVGRVHKKMFLNTFVYFFTSLTFFFVFDHKICVLIYFICFSFLFFFFLWSIKFPQQNTNQPETWIGGLKLSVELYIIGKPRKMWSMSSDMSKPEK